MGKSKTSKKPSTEARQEATTDPQTVLPWLAHLETLATGLFATLLIWSFLDPVDATSVFEGQALAQNLGWLTCGLLCALLAKFRGGFSCPRWSWGLGLLILAFLLWSTFAAGQENSPRRGWNGFWQVASIASCLCCSALLARNSNARSALVGLLLVGSFALSLQGLYQVTVVFPETRAAYEADPDGVIASIPGMVAPEGSPQRARLESRLYSSEPYSTFALANSLATLLSAALVLLSGVILDVFSHRSWLISGRAKLGLGAAIVASGIVLVSWFLTLSRTAYVGVAAGVASLLLLSFFSSGIGRRVGRGKLLAAGASFSLLFLAGLLTLWFYDSVVFTEAKKSLGYRLEYWQSTSEMIQDHAVTGVGLGNFQSYYPQYKLPVASEEIADPHNWIFDIAATFGVPALVCISLGLLLWLIRLVGTKTNSQSELAAETRLEDSDASESAFFIGAAIGGTVCSALLSLLKGQDFVITFVLWSTSAGLIFGAWPLLKNALKADSQKSAASAIAVLVCLLASGSWQASGIAIPLMVLLAAATPTAGVREQDKTSWAVLALPALALVAFVFQAWQPVNAAWARSQQALTAASTREQTSLSEQAVELDPLDDTLKSRLAQIYAVQAMSGGKGEFPRLARRALEVLDEWLEQDSHGFPNWRLACHLAMDLAARAADLQLTELEERFTEASKEHATRAIEAYPTSVELRLQLSAIAAWTNDLALAQTELSRAIQLSETTPHQDKKLGRHRTTLPGDQQIRFPFPALPADAWIGEQPTVNAEPLIEWIRSKLDAQR